MIRLEPAASRATLVIQVLWFAAWLVVTVVAITLAPSSEGHGTHTQLGLAPCPAVLMWGRLCPGCGLTTSFTALVHGNFGAAFTSHPIGPALYAIFTVTALASLAAALRGKRLQTNTRPFNLLLISLFVVFFAYGFWRFVWGPQVAL